ncbi:hypothetical protein DF16_pBMB293orf00119 (plasmid) [Bacillus thuringiensis serovar kurstaki str. YBT-1520]|nr:hypothetical protein H175_285p192 [Bacillus thuringiensis serovar thuringiensis str. IS5056]AIM34643.1 hypothetical protein DF16_pBMB293orf00119 [Bacillus thuringiensis serovar kurstaki str. YBT-1520]KLA26266.1 hypothetical protein B4158_6066 [Bacillus cereus]
MRNIDSNGIVAPHVGAWIEIGYGRINFCSIEVAPYIGA